MTTPTSPTSMFAAHTFEVSFRVTVGGTYDEGDAPYGRRYLREDILGDIKEALPGWLEPDPDTLRVEHLATRPQEAQAR